MKHVKSLLVLLLAALLAVSCTAVLAVTAEESGEAEPSMASDSALAVVESPVEIPEADEANINTEAEANVNTEAEAGVPDVPAAEEAEEQNSIASETVEAGVDAAVEETKETEENTEAEESVGIAVDEELEINAESKLYKEERLLLVTVNNKNADVNYSINVTVTYYGAEGEVIKSESKSFEQLKNGYSKNFIFRPGFDFVDYLIETEKTEYNGECWKTLIDAEFGYTYVWAYGDGRDARVRQHMEVTSHSEQSLVVDSFEVVVFDESGEIYDIFYRAGCWMNPTDHQYKHFQRELAVPESMVYYQGCETKCKLGGAFIEYDVIAPEETPDYEYLVNNGYIDPETGTFVNP